MNLYFRNFTCRLKLELEQCVQAMRDADPRAEEAGVKTMTARDVAETAEEKSGRREQEQLRRAAEERGLLAELAMSRMAERVRALELENSEARRRVQEAEEQMAGQGRERVPTETR